MSGALLAAATLLVSAGAGFAPRAAAQTLVPPANAAPSEVGILTRDKAALLMPPSVFFAGRTATIQARNSAGFRFPDGKLVLAALVDTSGYSTGVQERYQAYLIVEAPLRIAGKTVVPGAYGCGFVGSEFLVMNIAGDTVLTAPATRDNTIAHPTPLQILPSQHAGAFRLYAGRTFIEISGLA